ncbi:MAG: hybrid sensor histidine kinase/response regulator [Pseudomonadota bacterium]
MPDNPLIPETMPPSMADSFSQQSNTLSLRLRILLIALLPLLLAVGLFAAYFTHRSISDADTALQNRGQEAARRLAEAIALDLSAGNLPGVKRLMDLERESLSALSVALLESGQWSLLSGPANTLLELDGTSIPAITRKGTTYHFAHPVPPRGLVRQTASAPVAAYVVLSLSRDPVELARSHVGLAAVSVAMVCLALALILAWRLAGTLSKPLHDITLLVDQVTRGDLSGRVAEDTPGELGQLQRGVNLMAQRLEESQRVLEQRVQEATAELRAQKAHAESATLAKSRFLAAASHDLRQPLHALSLLVEALEERVPEGDARHLTGHISASVTAMEKLLNALLDLSRLDAGVVQAHPDCFPLNKVLDSIESQFSPLAQAQGLHLAVHRTRLWIYSDPALLERVLANLVANALRYTETGGVVVGVRRVQRDWLRLEVWDTGKGIPKEYQTRVFEEYFQLANPERHRDKGLGLGLAIVARVARLLGTQVNVRSNTDQGSCFHMRFARCHARRTEQTPESSPQRPSLPLEKALVAFIDDDSSILEAMVEVFDHWGVALAAGESGAQVCRELEELGRRPDVILSDYRLKDGETGIDAIRTLHAAFGPVPAALLTGDTASETINEIGKTGFPVLHKPLKPAKLRAFLSHLLADIPPSETSNQ